MNWEEHPGNVQQNDAGGGPLGPVSAASSLILRFRVGPPSGTEMDVDEDDEFSSTSLTTGGQSTNILSVKWSRGDTVDEKETPNTSSRTVQVEEEEHTVS